MNRPGETGGQRHADMHPATHKRVNAAAEVGRRLASYGEACRLLGVGEVLPAYTDRKRGELDQALAMLVEAAQEEGMAGAKEVTAA